MIVTRRLESASMTWIYVSTRDWFSYCMCVWLTHINRTSIKTQLYPHSSPHCFCSLFPSPMAMANSSTKPHALPSPRPRLPLRPSRRQASIERHHRHLRQHRSRLPWPNHFFIPQQPAHLRRCTGLQPRHPLRGHQRRAPVDFDRSLNHDEFMGFILRNMAGQVEALGRKLPITCMIVDTFHVRPSADDGQEAGDSLWVVLDRARPRLHARLPYAAPRVQELKPKTISALQLDRIWLHSVARLEASRLQYWATWMKV